jgi:GDP-L-fucose synthase
MLKGKKILVTGGAGFTGTNFIIKLLERGADVRATLFEKEAVLENKKIEYVRCDLRKSEDCLKVCEGIDYVFNCAAVTAGAEFIEKKPLFLLTPNILINIQMLEAAFEAGVKKFLFISSNTVYPLTDYPVNEDDVNYNFFEKYFIAGWMKSFCEIVCRMYSTKIEKPMTTIIIRPANLYGSFDEFDWKKSHVLPAIIRRVVERHNPIKIWGDGSDIKDFIYIEDYVKGLISAITQIEGFEILNLASGKGYVLKELIFLIMKLDGYEDAKIEFDINKPTMIPKRVLDPSKAKKILGFKAKTPIEEGLKKTIEWYRSTLV